MQKRLLLAIGVGSLLLLLLVSPSLAAEKHTLSFEVSPQAQILSIDSYLKVLKEFGGGKAALHFEIKIRNISDRAERFSVMVSTPDGASAAGFVPAKAKKVGALAVLEPKEEGEITLPLMTETLTGSFSVVGEIAPAE